MPIKPHKVPPAISATKLAKKLGVKLPPRGAAYNVSARVDRRLNDLTDIGKSEPISTPM